MVFSKSSLPSTQRFRASPLSAAILLALGGGTAQAQSPEEPLEEIVILGSQIQGARITGALPVSVVNEDDIAAMNAVSGDDLFRSIPEAGDITFNGTYLGGTNSNAARGDVSTVSLRGLAQGNTLVLVNGRRSVVHPTSQTDNSTPVFGYNVNAIPVAGLKRVEILKDGAAALYGSDAVAGVVNNVLQDDFTGFEINAQYGSSDGNEWNFNTLYGTDFAAGKGNVSLFFGVVQKDELMQKDRPFLATSDQRPFVEGTSFAGNTSFDNRTTSTGWGAFQAVNPDGSAIDYAISSNGSEITTEDGYFHIQPTSSSGCRLSIDTSLCYDDGNVTGSADRNLRGDSSREPGISQLPAVDRYNFFSFLNYDLSDSLSFFGEAGYYWAKTEAISSSAASLGSTPIIIPATNYYNPFGPVGSPNRLPGLNIPDEGLPLQIRAYRYLDTPPRGIEVENYQYRLLGGLRGEVGGWNWESAMLYNESNVKDTQDHNSSTLVQQALALSTPDAYNPFGGGDPVDLSNPVIGNPNPDSVIDTFLIKAVRENNATLSLWDFKLSKADLFALPGGDVGIATGIEYRHEGYDDNRDFRQDTSNPFVDVVTGTVYGSDLMGHSPSPDVEGSRNVTSAYVEFAIPIVAPVMDIPLVESFNLQVAGRYEDYSDVGSVSKPKVAAAWDVVEGFRLRGSWSQGFKAPNLEVLNIPLLERLNGRWDYIKCEADLRNGVITSYAQCAHNYGVPGLRQGNPNLKPEESESKSIGFVFEPMFLPPEFGSLIITVDKWEIEQEGIVGVLDEQSAITLDYLYRLQGSSNPMVNRLDPTVEETAAFEAAGLTPAGEIVGVDASFSNLLPLEVSGIDFGVVYDTTLGDLGDLRLNLSGTKLTDFFQNPSPQQQVLLDASNAGLLNPGITVSGAADLIAQNGNPEWKWTLTTTWSKGPWQVGLMTRYIDEVTQPGIVNAAGDAWVVDSQYTFNLYGQFSLDDETTFKLGARNITDEDPPFADGGYLGNLYQPYGRYVYASVHKSFF